MNNNETYKIYEKDGYAIMTIAESSSLILRLPGGRYICCDNFDFNNLEAESRYLDDSYINYVYCYRDPQSESSSFCVDIFENSMDDSYGATSNAACIVTPEDVIAVPMDFAEKLVMLLCGLVLPDGNVSSFVDR